MRICDAFGRKMYVKFTRFPLMAYSAPQQIQEKNIVLWYFQTRWVGFRFILLRTCCRDVFLTYIESLITQRVYFQTAVNNFVNILAKLFITRILWIKVVIMVSKWRAVFAFYTNILYRRVSNYPSKHPLCLKWH